MDEISTDSYEANTKEIRPETKEILHEFYQESNRELAFILKDDKYLWEHG